MTAAFLWCAVVALTGLFAGQVVGGWFSSDPQVAIAIVAILRPMLALYVFGRPDPCAGHVFAGSRSAWTDGRTFTLVKPWFLMPILILGLSAVCGVNGIWLAFPIADGVVLLIAVVVGRSILLPGKALGPEGVA